MRSMPPHQSVIKADISRAEKARYYNCRSDPDDESESADFIGLSSYLHCDGAATSIEEMAGYTKLLEDYESFDLTVPVIVTEFGCLHNSFEEINGHEAQRNFLQVEALYSKEFREVRWT